jgi:RNA polymerase sigma-70 factor (ECF subfamily)
MKEENSNNIEDVFLEWYGAHNDGIFRFCLLKTSNRNVALDITQETFSKVWEYLSKGNEIKEPKAFLYRIATNIVIDFYRKKKSDSLDTMIESGFDPMQEDYISPEKFSEIQELHAKLAMLDDKHKDVIIMRFINDMSVQDIAAIYDEHENTISVRIHRALEKLRATYKTK